jgi:hypothetical protein
MHHSSNIHLDEAQKVGVKTKASIGDKECLTIGVGKKFSDGNFIADTEITMFLTVSQLVDLYHDLHNEIQKYGVHS